MYINKFGYKEEALMDYNDLKELKLNARNRLVDKNHVKEVFQGIEDWKKFARIIVNPITMHILDGQHRCQALIQGFEKGIIPMDAMVVVDFESYETDDEEVEAIIKYNSNSKNWQTKDFIRNYIQSNEESYVKLDEFCRTHELAYDLEKDVPRYRYAQALILGKGGETSLKSGKFVASDEDFERGDKIHNEVIKVMELSELPKSGSFIEPFILSWCRHRNDFDFDSWLKIIKKHKDKFAKVTKATKRTEWDNLFNSIFHEELTKK